MSHALRTAALAATALVATFGLSACDSGSSTSADATPKASAATPASTPASGPAATPAGTSAPTSAGAPGSASGSTPSAGAPATTGTSSTNGKPAAATVGRCHTSALKFSFGNGDQTYSSTDDQQHLQVLMTNTSGSACTVKGFPGVDLKAADTWSLVRSSKPVSTVTLKSGGSASFVISYLPWQAGDGVEFKAKSVVITPPDETTSATLNWPGGSVLRQDGATHPGTFAGPVTAS